VLTLEIPFFCRWNTHNRKPFYSTRRKAPCTITALPPLSKPQKALEECRDPTAAETQGLTHFLHRCTDPSPTVGFFSVCPRYSAVARALPAGADHALY